LELKIEEWFRMLMVEKNLRISVQLPRFAKIYDKLTPSLGLSVITDFYAQIK
jgi:hypothetical protein